MGRSQKRPVVTLRPVTIPLPVRVGQVDRVAPALLTPQIDRAPRLITCFDHMVITLWGEHYAAIRKINHLLDACKRGGIGRIFEQLFDNAQSTFGVSHKDVDAFTSFQAWLPDTSLDECINVDLNKVDALTAQAIRDGAVSTSNLRHIRHVSSADKRARRKHRVELGTCHVSD